jgi:hypothetical protein
MNVPGFIFDHECLVTVDTPKVFMDNNAEKTLPVGFSPTYTQWESSAQPWATEPCVGEKNSATVRK